MVLVEMAATAEMIAESQRAENSRVDGSSDGNRLGGIFSKMAAAMEEGCTVRRGSADSLPHHV
jgi:hypothetical protein